MTTEAASVLRGAEFLATAELGARAVRVATGLAKLGVGPSDTVALLMRTDHAIFEASFAAALLRAARYRSTGTAAPTRSATSWATPGRRCSWPTPICSSRSSAGCRRSWWYSVCEPLMTSPTPTAWLQRAGPSRRGRRLVSLARRLRSLVGGLAG